MKFSIDVIFFFINQTSQDPSSPLGAIPSTSIPSSTAANMSAQRNSDIRDEWSWNDWGSLEEQPVSSIVLLVILRKNDAY